MSDLPAGAFSAWLVEIGRADQQEGGVDVPCGDCSACCTSSQFIHVGSEETETLALIPDELKFPAPGQPKGNVVLGYDEHGHCPMFVERRCSIYEHRPRTCRTYDCRVFPAAGVELTDADKGAITERARRWGFDFPTPMDRAEHAAVEAAASFLAATAHDLPDGAVPRSPTQLAYLAVRIHDLFLEPGVKPSLEVVEGRLRRASLGWSRTGQE